MKNPSDYISKNLGVGVDFAPDYDIISIRYSAGGKITGRVLIQEVQGPLTSGISQQH